MKTFIGTVISDKMNQTAVVLVERRYQHPLYGKIISKRARFHAVNALGAKVGQKVSFVETRPVSKTIFFKITKILEETKGAKEEVKIETKARRKKA
jgi:small subunit ribosomal protein S17